MSAENFGFLLGVSGATIRRWESGIALPSDTDLARFAEICQLSVQQREFLSRLFGRRPGTAESAPVNFPSVAASVLALSRPAYVTDELFYIRAWNSMFVPYAGPLAAALPSGPNGMRIPFEVEHFGQPDAQFDRQLNAARVFWMWTANLASTPQYTALIQEMLTNEAFAPCWQEIVDESNETPLLPLTLPILNKRVEKSSYTVYTCELLFPPLYRIFVYEPVDLEARAAVAALTEKGEPEVFFAEHLHWSSPPPLRSAR